MKKNVIALAVAAAMAAPLAAQADVSVSGSMQAELQNISKDDNTTTKDGLYLTNGNRGMINIKASEDLGNGMSALAHYGFDATATTAKGTNLTQRDAYIGLSGGFGTILVGTMSNPYKSSTVGWDPLLETGGQARGQYGMSTLHNGYTADAIAYANKFGMAKVTAAIVVDESTTAGNDSLDGEHGMALSVNVPVGPVEVAVAHINLPSTDTAGSNDESASTKVGVRYAAGAMSVAAQYEQVGGNTVGGEDQTFAYINGTYTFGANTVLAAYGNNTVSPDGAADQTNTYMAVGIAHGFSKKTNVYAGYMAVDPEGNSNNTTGIVLGMRVNF